MYRMSEGVFEVRIEDGYFVLFFLVRGKESEDINMDFC